MHNRSFADQVNETPTTYGLLLIYITMAVLTDPFEPSREDWIQYGGCAGLLVQDGQVWRLLSCAFLHGGILHLLLNSYGLMILGPMLERHMGIARFILLYAISAIGGSLVAVLMNFEFVFLVGGSGALFGMLGAALAYNVRGGRTMLDFMENHGSRQLITLIILNLLVGFFIPQVSNSAHIGGLCTGFVLVFCFLAKGREEVDLTGRAIQAGWIAVILSLLFYTLHPVMRFGYNLQAHLQATDPIAKEKYREFLRTADGPFPFSATETRRFLASEQEPKTGIIGVAYRERPEIYGPMRKVVRRWKRGN